MKRNWQANLSLIFVIVFVALTFAMGAKQYNHTREKIIANLNEALRETVKMHANNWLCRDTIQSYARLQQQIGTAVTVHAYDQVFSEALADERFKRNAGIQICVIRMSHQGPDKMETDETDNGYIMSDTLMLMNSAKVADAALSLRGFVYCPFINVMKMTDMTAPGILLLIAFLFAGFHIYIKSKSKEEVNTQNAGFTDEHLVSFGGLSLCTIDHCIYDTGNRRLNLTPMEYSLMEMFYRTSSHFLLKKDICDRLWPGKDNADETLYALIRRLKQTLSEHSSIKISVVRGRAYQLEINEID